MVKPRLYSVFDIKPEKFFAPFVSENDATADRRFCELLVDPQAIMSKHPQDYRLFAVGEFDEDTGQCVPFEKGIVCVNEGLTMGRPADVATAEEEAIRKFRVWLASRGLEANANGEVRQLDRGGR